jgi:predicted nuclease of restriction endonuclease-like (RecB) superfamily
MKRCNHEGSMNNLTANTNLVNDIRHLLEQSRQRLQKTVNSTMVQSYWQVGCLIVEDEQQGESRANYGKKVLKQLASVLTIEFGKGFDERNLRNMRLFYINFPIRNALRTELSWTHYRTLIRIENEQARQWYLNESIEQAWSARALERQIGVLYYERLLSSKDGKDVKTEATEKTLPLAIAKENYLRDPYILEFLNLPTQNVLETDIEHSIIDNLQKFILELGKGFAFVERQQRISTQDQDFYIDLVFYNFKLKCFLLIDLKIGKLTHQDVGQMDTYVRMYDQLKKQQDDNPTIGLILCSEKSEAVAKYSVLADQKQLFASKYLAFLPTEEELRKELKRERLLLSQSVK